MSTRTDTKRQTILNEIFKRGVNATDSYRQILYPRLPQSYELNPAISAALASGEYDNVPTNQAAYHIIQSLTEG